VSGGLPFLADLALGLSVLACAMLRILYNGPDITREEEACHDLLCSKLLQRYADYVRFGAGSEDPNAEMHFSNLYLHRK